jgi:arginyl-tRNA synthetase
MNNKDDVLKAVKKAVKEAFPDADTSGIICETPKNNELGDVAVPLFSLAKSLRKAPAVIAEEVFKQLLASYPQVKINVVAAYINIFYDKASIAETVLKKVMANKEAYGENSSLHGQKIMIEFSGPNTNKPLHLGHLRNDCLGETMSRLFKKSGADVRKVNIVNDRGVHICKSMLAYKLFGNGRTPESEGIKSDHFVGDYYVKYTNWEKENKETAENAIQEMLQKWEAGDKETLELWHLMNNWAISGMNETYEKTGISFDKVYYESETYKLGKDIIEDGLARKVFYKADDGSIRLDLTELDGKSDDGEVHGKVFLRADGTSVYITQDLGTAIRRHEDFPFDRLIYVVAHEQQRHFQILFYALKKLGYSWAAMLYHLSYGMVNLPDGKMKSREGTVVDADDLIEELRIMAQREIDEKGRSAEVSADTAFKVGLGALHYYLQQVNPVKDMVFNKEESLSFNGNTGPYIQYTAARIASLLRKDKAAALAKITLDTQRLVLDEEWQLVRMVGDFPDIVSKAAVEYMPNTLANYLYELAKLFNRYYHDIQILNETDEVMAAARLSLAETVHTVLKNGMTLLNIPYLDKM